MACTKREHVYSKNLPAMQEMQETGFDLWVGKIPWKKKWQPTSAFLPGKSHGQSLTGCNSWGCKIVGQNLVSKQ